MFGSRRALQHAELAISPLHPYLAEEKARRIRRRKRRRKRRVAPL
jgi:hypothetical protein